MYIYGGSVTAVNTEARIELFVLKRTAIMSQLYCRG
jgi:hypothetical protein